MPEPSAQIDNSPWLRELRFIYSTTVISTELIDRTMIWIASPAVYLQLFPHEAPSVLDRWHADILSQMFIGDDECPAESGKLLLTLL